MRLHECFEHSEAGIIWNAQFRMDFRDTETSDLKLLPSLLDSHGLSLISSTLFSQSSGCGVRIVNFL